MAWSKSFSLNYASGGDTVKGAVQKLEDELTTIFGHLNNLDKAHYGASEPSSPDTGDLWMDSSGPDLKYYNGSAWVAVWSAAVQSGSGLSLDAALLTYAHNIYAKVNGDNIEIVASASAPATLGIQGQMYQNTATVTLDKSAIAAGTYYLYADILSTGFTLAYDGVGTPDGTQRKIGEFTLSDTGVVDEIVMYHLREAARERHPAGFFKVQLGTNDPVVVGESKLAFSAIDANIGTAYNSGSGRLEPGYPGYWFTMVTAYFLTGGSANQITFRVKKNGSTIMSFVHYVAGASDAGQITFPVSVYLDADDYVEIYQIGSGNSGNVVATGTWWEGFCLGDLGNAVINTML